MKQADRERQRGAVRSMHLRALEEAGKARAEALREADAQLDRIARLLPDALDGGLALTEIARVTEVSRPTLYELRARYGDSARDLNLAVLQSLAVRGPQSTSEVIEHIGAGKSKQINGLLHALDDQGFLHMDIDEVEREQVWYLTSKGEALLDHWDFEEAIEREAGGA